MKGSTLKAYTYVLEECSPRGERKQTYRIGGSNFYNACVNYINITKTKININSDRVFIHRAATEELPVLIGMITKGALTFAKIEEPNVEKGFAILTGTAVAGKPRKELKVEESNNYKITVKISK